MGKKIIATAMRHILFLGALAYMQFAYIRVCYGQELVTNGGFEKLSKCPDPKAPPGQLHLATGWHAVNTPDLHTPCNNSSPTNFMGTMPPHTGTSYCGFYFLISTLDIEENQKSNFYQREYIYNSLSTPLTRGATYTVSLYVSLAGKSGFFSDRIGFCLTKNKLKYKNATYTLLKSENLVVMRSKEALSHAQVWEKLSFTYKARGGERYLTIGLFDGMITYEECQRLMNENAVSEVPGPCYYYIDDVSIREVEN